MTNWRTQKLALISALWMLFAFIMPMVSPLCAAMSPNAAAQCASMNDAASATQNANDYASMPCCASQKSVPIRCCFAEKSPFARTVAVVSASSNRVLDIADTSDLIVTKSFPSPQFEVAGFCFQRAEQSRRHCSRSQSPPSGRAPPVVSL